MSEDSQQSLVEIANISVEEGKNYQYDVQLESRLNTAVEALSVFSSQDGEAGLMRLRALDFVVQPNMAKGSTGAVFYAVQKSWNPWRQISLAGIRGMEIRCYILTYLVRWWSDSSLPWRMCRPTDCRNQPAQTIAFFFTFMPWLYACTVL